MPRPSVVWLGPCRLPASTRKRLSAIMACESETVVERFADAAETAVESWRAAEATPEVPVPKHAGTLVEHARAFARTLDDLPLEVANLVQQERFLMDAKMLDLSRMANLAHQVADAAQRVSGEARKPRRPRAALTGLVTELGAAFECTTGRPASASETALFPHVLRVVVEDAGHANLIRSDAQVQKAIRRCRGIISHRVAQRQGDTRPS